MKTITIKPSRLVVDEKFARISAEIVFPEKTETLWFECSAEFADMLCPENSESFLLAALLPAMRRGEDIVVEGALSSKFFYNMSSYYVDITQILIPGTHKINIIANNLTRKQWGGKGVFTGFSAGIDSFCTILDHASGRVPDEYAVTHYLFNNVGSHGQHDKAESVFRRRFDRLNQVARAQGIPFISVNSNLNDFIGMDFQLTHTMRNVAVALLFQKGCGKFLYSSTFGYRDVHVSQTYDPAYADAICVSLLSTETTESLSSGGQHSRIQKTKIVAQDETAREFLDVCVSPLSTKDVNCSRCWKCLRTELTLEIIGKLPEFHKSFDIGMYEKMRWLYLAYVLRSHDALLKEIQEEIKARNFPVPVSAKIFAWLVPNKVIDKMLNFWGKVVSRTPRELLAVLVRKILRRSEKRLTQSS